MTEYYQNLFSALVRSGVGEGQIRKGPPFVVMLHHPVEGPFTIKFEEPWLLKSMAKITLNGAGANNMTQSWDLEHAINLAVECAYKADGRMEDVAEALREIEFTAGLLNGYSGSDDGLSVNLAAELISRRVPNVTVEGAIRIMALLSKRMNGRT